MPCTSISLRSPLRGSPGKEPVGVAPQAPRPPTSPSSAPQAHKILHCGLDYCLIAHVYNSSRSTRMGFIHEALHIYSGSACRSHHLERLQCNDLNGFTWFRRFQWIIDGDKYDDARAAL